MKIIKSYKELKYEFYGLDKWKLIPGNYLANIKGVYVKPRNDETTQVYIIFTIYIEDRGILQSQMFYMSNNQESIFDKFFSSLGLSRDGHEGYAFEELIGQVGSVTIQNGVSNGTEYSNIVNFMPMNRDAWDKEWDLLYGEQV